MKKFNIQFFSYFLLNYDERVTDLLSVYFLTVMFKNDVLKAEIFISFNIKSIKWGIFIYRFYEQYSTNIIDLSIGMSDRIQAMRTLNNVLSIYVNEISSRE